MSSPAATFSGHVVPVTSVKQAYSNWCWAACCEMFAKFYGFTNLDQYAFVTKVNGKLPAPTDKFQSTSEANSAAGPAQFLKYLQEGIPTAKAKEYLDPTKTPSEMDKDRFTRDAIKRFLDGNRIMIFGSGSHAMILVGYGTKGSEEVIVVMDPQPGGPVSLSWSSFEKCAWVVYKPRTA